MAQFRTVAVVAPRGTAPPSNRHDADLSQKMLQPKRWLIEQAEFWFRLAKEQDEGADIQVPVAQQQQQQQPQVQPEDDNEKE